MKKHLATLLALLPGATFAEAPTYTVTRQYLEQGGYLIGQTNVGSLVNLNGTPTPVGKKGEFLIGFDRDAPLASQLNICTSAGECTTETLPLTKRTWVVQNVTKIPKATVNPDPAETKRTEQDSAATAAARKQAVEGAARYTAFTKPFAMPIDVAPSKATSGVFGSRRTYNGEERSWHKGHDFAAPTGTPVHAPASGIVRLARNTFMSGNLLILDHGGGLTTVYAHLSKMNVKAGDEVLAGDLIGAVGTTGRSSGPHLHWGTYWQNTAIDPMLWVTTKPSTMTSNSVSPISEAKAREIALAGVSGKLDQPKVISIARHSQSGNWVVRLENQTSTTTFDGEGYLYLTIDATTGKILATESGGKA